MRTSNLLSSLVHGKGRVVQPVMELVPLQTRLILPSLLDRKPTRRSPQLCSLQHRCRSFEDDDLQTEGRCRQALEPKQPVTSSTRLGCSTHTDDYLSLQLSPRKRYLEPDYEPISVAHPVFGQQQAVVRRQRSKQPLSTVHPAFGTQPKPLPQNLFKGPIGVSGFFLAIDPTLSIGFRTKMNPNAQLTIRDQDGNSSRVRYRCHLHSSNGIKFEVMVRFQVGWISPRVSFSEVPNVIHLGRGFDISVPFLFHFTMVSLLDEHGCATGSYLYFSGTPWLGLSLGWSSIEGGKLVMDPSRDPNPKHESIHHFFGHYHYRQVGFVLFKIMVWVLFTAACIPPVRRALMHLLPNNPLMWYSEMKH